VQSKDNIKVDIIEMNMGMWTAFICHRLKPSSGLLWIW